MVGIHLQGLFVEVPLAVFKPANHPLIDGFPTDDGHAVPTRSHQETYIVLGFIYGVPLPSFLVDELDSLVDKVVLIVFGGLE